MTEFEISSIVNMQEKDLYYKEHFPLSVAKILDDLLYKVKILKISTRISWKNKEDRLT